MPRGRKMGRGFGCERANVRPCGKVCSEAGVERGQNIVMPIQNRGQCANMKRPLDGRGQELGRGLGKIDGKCRYAD